MLRVHSNRRWDKSGMEDSHSYPFQLHIYEQTHCEVSALIVPGLCLMTEWPIGLEQCGSRFIIQEEEPFSVSDCPIQQAQRPPTEAHRIRCVLRFSNLIECE